MKIIPFCKNLLVHDINEINMDILKGLEIYRELKSLHFEILFNQTLCDPQHLLKMQIWTRKIEFKKMSSYYIDATLKRIKPNFTLF